MGKTVIKDFLVIMVVIQEVGHQGFSGDAPSAFRFAHAARQIEPGKTGPKTELRVDAHPQLRGDVARHAGLSTHQAKQAIRVANVPAEDFESQVTSTARRARAGDHP